jgi:hypothetical protein
MVADALKFLEHGFIECLWIRRCEVAQPAPFQITPYALHGIQVGGIGGKRLNMEAWIILLQLPDVRPLVHRTAIPDDDHWTTQVFEELPDEPGHGNMVEVVVDEIAEIQPEATRFRRQSQSSDDGDFVATSAAVSDLVEQLRCLAFGGQGATHQRRHEEAALVDKEQMRP